MRHRHGHRIGLSVTVISITLVLFENCTIDHARLNKIYNSFDRTYIDEIYATLCCLATLAYSNYFGDGEI